MPLDLKKLSINDLLSRLHESVSSLAKNVGRLTERNRELSLTDIVELREHIKSRLVAKEETAENESLLRLVELFKEDKNALELIKIDLNEWLEFMDAIKFHLERDVKGAGREELRDIEKLKLDITKLQGVLRKA